jgi:hypothetical protein
MWVYAITELQEVTMNNASYSRPLISHDRHADIMHSLLVTLEILVRTGVASSPTTLVQNNNKKHSILVYRRPALCYSCMSEQDCRTRIKEEYSESLGLWTLSIVRDSKY